MSAALWGRSRMCPMEDSTTYPGPRYPEMVRALAGDSTMTSLCATAWLLILCDVIDAWVRPTGCLRAVKVARQGNGPVHPSSPDAGAVSYTHLTLPTIYSV